jgi:hypothetical protein
LTHWGGYGDGRGCLNKTIQECTEGDLVKVKNGKLYRWYEKSTQRKKQVQRKHVTNSSTYHVWKKKIR